MIAGVPYDAEVEYLESTGTQWIDTGIVPGENDEIRCRQQAQVVIDHAFWGLASSAYCFSNVNTTYWAHPALGSGGNWGRDPLGNTNWHEVLCSSRGVFVDGTQINSTSSGSVSSPQNSMALFARAVNSSGGGVAKLAKGRVSMFSVTRNGTLIADFIPVRVGDVGYLYDRVTRKLFGNAGPGSFVLGPDVATPVMGLHFYKKKFYAKDYVQDALVAIWDGIENAGWGVHDPNATVWKDLINGTSDIVSASEVFSDYMLDYSGIRRWLTPPSGIGTPISLEACESHIKRYSNWFHAWSSDDDLNSCGWSSYTNNNVEWKTNSGTLNRPNANYNGGTIAGTFSQGTASLYVNGRLSSQTTTQFAWTSAAALKWGGYLNGGARGTKRVHCVRLYSRTLTAEEIAYNYSIDKARFNLL